jgi:hypothetical protein
MLEPHRGVWELNADPNRHLCVQQSDLRFFQDRFVGMPMSAGWQTPPYEILTRSRRVADLTSWQIGSRAFLVTERARDAIAELCGSDVEFLHFDQIKGSLLFALNALRIEDLRDRSRASANDEIWGMSPVLFDDVDPRDIPPMFKCGPDSPIYVSNEFGAMAVREKLTGVRLADPEKIRVQQIVRGEPLNEFPGL